MPEDRGHTGLWEAGRRERPGTCAARIGGAGGDAPDGPPMDPSLDTRPSGGWGEAIPPPGFVGCLGGRATCLGLPGWGSHACMCTLTQPSLSVHACVTSHAWTRVTLSVARACTLVPEPGCAGVSPYAAPTPCQGLGWAEGSKMWEDEGEWGPPPLRPQVWAPHRPLSPRCCGPWGLPQPPLPSFYCKF